MSQAIPSSPTAQTRKALALPTIIPLESASRQEPIHHDLPSIKVPSNSDTKSYAYHPVTCEPLTAEDLLHHKLAQYQKQYTTPEEAKRAQEDAVKEVKARLEENDRRRREVEREMEIKEKMREVERKGYEEDGEGEVGAGVIGRGEMSVTTQLDRHFSTRSLRLWT